MNEKKLQQHDGEFVLSLALPLGTIIDQRHVDAAYKEAMSFPEGSKARLAFLSYYDELRDRLYKQKMLDGK